MYVKELSPGKYEVQLSTDEAYQLRILVNNSRRWEITDISTLISFQLSYLAEMAFTTIPEPQPSDEDLLSGQDYGK